MRAGTIILAASGAPDERKSHEAMSAPMSNMDPNEVPNAAKKVTSHLLELSGNITRIQSYLNMSRIEARCRNASAF